MRLHRLQRTGVKTAAEYEARRRRLEGLLRWSSSAMLSRRHADGVALFGPAMAAGWEGVVGKRLAEPYLPGKRAWVKVKVWREGVFYVIGFTEGAGKREGRFGAMRLGRLDEGTLCLRHVGDCEAGLDDGELRLLGELRRGYGRMAFGDRVLKTCDPGSLLKVRVKYAEETGAGMLRFPVYVGLE